VRSLPTILGALLALAVLTGCGNSSPKTAAASGTRAPASTPVRFLNLEECSNAPHCPTAAEERAIDARAKRQYGMRCGPHQVNLLIVRIRGARSVVTGVESECHIYRRLFADESAARVVPGPLPPSLERLAKGE
jgi:hypothetical protein